MILLTELQYKTLQMQNNLPDFLVQAGLPE
jgi:hypothetical protein